MNICLKVNTDKGHAIKCAKEIITLLTECGATILMKRDAKEHFESFKDIIYYKSDNELFANADKAVTVGGDGTIIHNARHAAENNIPLIGVNCGHLGFAAEIEPEEVSELKRLLTDDYTTDERMVI